MKLLSKSELVNSLLALGIGAGDIVHVQSDLRRIGPVDAPLTREGVCGFYLAALQEVVGPEGTITCCTSFEDYGRFGTPFDRQQSPSRTDTFSDFIRTRSGAIRSCHPILSVTALGPAAEAICGGEHKSGFGHSSPWGRLHRANAKILSLGIGHDVQGGMTFLHFVEASYGVPYQYVKLYDAPVYDEGKLVPGPFMMHVRYLDFSILNSVHYIKARLLADGFARQGRTGCTNSYCVSAGTAFDWMTTYLDENIWSYLDKAPTFRRGEIPFDGPVGEMRESYDKHGD